MEDKKVLYVTTKNIDYIRNIQIINMLKKKYSNVEIIYSKRKNYYLRIIEVNLKLMIKNRKKYDIIFFGFLPQLILMSLYKKKNEKQIFIMDFIISLYNTLVLDRKKVKEGSIISKILKKIDIKVSSMSDIVYTDTKVQAKNIAKEFKVNKEKIKVLYLEANTKLYNKKVKKINLKEKDKFVVLWFGTVLPLQGIDVIIKAAKILDYNKNIKFYIIGNTKKLNVKEEEHENIEFLGWLQDNIIARYIKSADICLAGHFALENPRANREIPGKAFTYKAMEKKMILGESEANREIFKEDNKKIFYVERGNYKKLADLIEKIYDENE